jgi:hypothetical protein
MTIRFGSRKGFPGHSAAGAAAIVNHDWLAKRHSQPFAKRAGQDVGGAAGGEGHENPDRPAGKGRRLGQRRGGEPGGEKGKAGTAGDGGHAGWLLLIAKTYAEWCRRESFG